MTKLSALLAGAGMQPDACYGDSDIGGITADSRAVKPRDLFVCMPSETRDTHDFIESAVEKGATAVLVHSRQGFEKACAAEVPACYVADEGLKVAEFLWRMARTFHENPTKNMRVIGITGTNGKTTTAWLIRDMLLHLGLQAAYLGTLGFQVNDKLRELPNTTPFSIDLFNMLAEARDAGVQALAMEVSSHALDQRRVDGIEFDAAVFTNLTQDHLDYHGSMEAYAKAKLRLFDDLGRHSSKDFVAALNVDDPYGKEWSRQLGGNVLTYGARDAELVGVVTRVQIDTIELALRMEGESVSAKVPLGGAFNAQNCLSAAAGMVALGYELRQIANALRNVSPVPGRFEPVPNDKGIGVIVDYAHTPDALEKLLDSVRDLHPARVVTVFGCGGDRDRTKRPKMAKAASERSDEVVLTSDNPRTENPDEILLEVEKGLKPGVPAVKIADRREAIAYTMERAKPGDVIVIAGKGHENYQIIGRTKYPMDDRELVREALSKFDPERSELGARPSWSLPKSPL